MSDGEPSGDGFGQSLWDDLRWTLRFRRVRRDAIAWRPPTHAEATSWEAHALAGRFGDAVVAVATHVGRDWVVRDRLWYGWPDPPRFVVFAFERDAVWLAKDFNLWPPAWGPEPA